VDEAEFDKFAEEYRSLHAANISITGEDPEYFAEYKIKDLAEEYFSLARGIGSPPSMLDFGAGIGSSIPFVRKYLPLADLTCVDVSTKSLQLGEARFRGQARFVHFDGSRIPFPDAKFDIAFAACVFHHIDAQEHIPLLEEFRRVLVPGGIAVVFEHNPYNPLTVHAVNTCPFDEKAVLIPAATMQARLKAAGFGTARITYRIFFPRVLRALRPLERWMTWLPLGGQYFVLAVK
jgi:ubiquinone/menaquinone biosynthesis C-methylase UbiE